MVVLGSSDFARFAAEGIAAMGSSVTLVSTKKPSVRNKSIQVVPPAIGDDDTGFASYIGEFDALLDTAQNERPSRRGMFTTSDDDDDGTTTDMGSSMVLKLLKDRHKCERYISSMTQAQNIIYRDGVFFGPGKVKEHFANLQEKYKSRPAMFETIIPPASFGQTVQTLLENDIVYKSSKEFLTGNKNNVIARGWSLSDFMEVNMWPQNSAGGGTRSVRYGFPVLEEVEDDMLDAMISAPPETADQKFIAKDKWDEDIEREERKRDEVDQRNPYVRKIVGAKQLHEHIVKDEKDAVLFMSATWCRTCRSLNPKFTYMARQTSEKNEENSKKILFAKADTTGEIGKDLGRLLNVDSVPAFLLFRKGRRFGPPLSISKMPSKKLKVAIELLESGLDWDSNSIKEAEKKSR